MNHILDIEKDKEYLFKIFEHIQQSNTILFLGAGASVGEKICLSKEIIKYYELSIGYSFKENNITKFVDILEIKPELHRSDFDNFVVTLLHKLKTKESHRILASIPWREIF